MKRRQQYSNIEIRLFSRIIKNPETGCWNYQTKQKYRQPRITWNKKTWLCSRVAWTLTYGDIPEGMCICHKCDNPMCINPDHLFLGTQYDNMLDMFKKKRHVFGTRVSQSKLTDEEVNQIKILLRKKELSHRAIGLKFGVTSECISQIAIRKTWKHIKF